MSREIKFEFIWKKGTTIVKQVMTMDQIIGTVAHPVKHRRKMPLIAKRQYTGLKDINGVEIFESDIIHNSNFVDNCNHEVLFLDDLGCWFICDIKNGYTEWLSDFVKTSEVIGNRFENPELLK